MIKKFKIQNSKFKNLSFIFTFLVLNFTLVCYAKEITIIYTGQTHGMIYPCACPIEPDGGIARRATLIKQLRKEHPDNLLLDSGDFFAGGLMDEYTQNTELDSRRSIINLEAMELMKYDAAAVGDDEFNFGREFFQKDIGNSKLVFLSCNLKSDNVVPFIIKEVGGIKIGIIGVTTVSAKQKAGGLEFGDPKAAVSSAVAELQKKNVSIIILLSQLGEDEDSNLISDVKGIDILIESHSKGQEVPLTKIGDTLLLRPSWEGRRLNILTLTVEGNKIEKYKTDETRLLDQVPDDPDILAMLPRCFSDNNCKKEGFFGACKDAGSLKSQCEFKKANEVRMLVITSKECIICETAPVVSYFKKQFPGLSVSYIYYPDKKADGFIKDFEVLGLPAYFLGKEAGKEKNFDNLKGNLKLKGDYYMVMPYFSGFSYFFNREKIKDKLDVFISLYDKTTAQLLDVIKEFNPEIHFLAIEEADKFDAPRGQTEIDEDLRGVCIKKYYPQAFWDYISCRSKNIESTWWQDCIANLDLNKITSCARGDEGKALLRENTKLTKELHIMLGPIYLLDNREIFSSKGAPTKEELKRIIKR